MNETKDDFFGLQEAEDYDPPENKIIETKIDPLEWKAEVDRVYQDLTNIDKEIQIMKKNGAY